MLRSHKGTGFTLVELLVSISIFIFMTALLVANYGSFNNSVLLTNLAYDIALSIRTAQTYGLSVQGQNNNFQNPYGVAFCAISICSDSTVSFTNKQVILFSDSSASKGAYNTGDALVPPNYAIKNGAFIGDICLYGNAWQCGQSRVDITFLRPNPDALICLQGSGGAPFNCSGSLQALSVVKIIVQAPDGNQRSIIVRKTGEISVVNGGANAN